MHARQDSGAAGIVALALDFHRAPTRHGDLLHGRGKLPPGVGVLLKLAGGSEPEPEWAGLAPPEELQAASLFFIEQVLFRHDSDHYRLLGVGPGASAEQIKEHHRLLMRVFHPDRENRADDWKDAFATRINLAYTALRDPQSRRDYDATLTPTVGLQRNLPAPHRAGSFPAAARPRSRMGGLPPVLLRYLPQWVLAGTALIACLVVGMVYLNNPPAASVPQHGIASQAAASRPDVGMPAQNEQRPETAPQESPRPPIVEAVAVVRTRPAPGSRPLPDPDAQQASAKPAPVLQSKADASQAARTETPASAASQRPQTESEPRTPPPAKPVIEVTAVAEPTPQPAQAQAQAIQTAAAPSPPAPPHAGGEPARPAQPDPDATLAQFVATFERGDTGAFMALFDDVAIGRGGGKSNIRREHEVLFRSTDLRHIAIDGMTWSRDGDWIRGEGRYRTTLMRKGELLLRTETGVIRLQLVRHGDQMLIMGLDLQPGARS